MVTRRLQHFGDGDIAVIEIGRVVWDIVARGCVTAVQPRHQRAARRCANRTARVGLGEAQPLRRQLVDVRRGDVFSAVAAEVTVAEIIGQDEDDVGLVGAKSNRRREKEGGEEEFHFS